LALANSAAYVDNLVNQSYSAYLNQGSVAPSVLRQWEAAFRGGTTQQQFIATLLSSAALYQYATTVTSSTDPNPSNTNFIQGVVQALYNGIPGVDTATPAEVQLWLGRLATGTTRLQMIQSLEQGQRYLNTLITSAYAAVFPQSPTPRPPTPQELATWRAA